MKESSFLLASPFSLAYCHGEIRVNASCCDVLVVGYVQQNLVLMESKDSIVYGN